jgi:4a-hydroxytetrahydrobiopterin dehydratase
MDDSPLTDPQIDEILGQLSDWAREGDHLVKTYTFGDFKAALAFMVRAGFEAEARNHHPEWSNVYNRVEVRLSSHSAGSKITAKDADLATAFDLVCSSG